MSDNPVFDAAVAQHAKFTPEQQEAALAGTTNGIAVLRAVVEADANAADGDDAFTTHVGAMQNALRDVLGLDVTLTQATAITWIAVTAGDTLNLEATFSGKSLPEYLDVLDSHVGELREAVTQ